MKTVLIFFTILSSYGALSFNTNVNDLLPCDADRFLTKDRIREAWKKYPDYNQPFGCQIATAISHPNQKHTQYNKCVKPLIDHYMQLQPGGMMNPHNHKEMKKKLRDNKPFAEGLKKCSMKLKDCNDVYNVHHCIINWAES